MTYRGDSMGGFVGNHLSVQLLEQLRPAADNVGRLATVGTPGDTASYHISQGRGWEPVTTFATDPLTGRVTGLVGPDGTLYPIGPLVVTMAQAQAALAAASTGAVWNVSDVGGGTLWTKSAGGILKPLNNICTAFDIPAPVTFAAGVTQRIYAEYLIPAATLQNGFIFDVDPIFSKSGNTDAMTLHIAMSATAGTVGTTITQSGAISFLIAANRRAQGSLRFQRLSATTIGNTVTGVAGASGAGLTSGGAYAAVTVPTMESAVYLQVCGTASGSTDTMRLESCPVTIRANPNT